MVTESVLNPPGLLHNCGAINTLKLHKRSISHNSNTEVRRAGRACAAAALDLNLALIYYRDSARCVKLLAEPKEKSTNPSCAPLRYLE